MKKIVVFGDSFLAGAELNLEESLINPEVDASIERPDLAWPALIAKKLNVEWETFAISGCGNDAIARQVYSYFADNTPNNTLAIIQWSAIRRLDYYVSDHKKWITIDLHSCVPRNLSWLNDETEANNLLDMGFKYFGPNDNWNNNRTLQIIFGVQSYLKSIGVPSIQTYLDYEMMEDAKDGYPFDEYNYIKNLRQQLTLELFPGNLNFVDWAKSSGFKVTDAGRHPLNDAHIAAADYWQSRYEKLLSEI